MTDNNCQYCGKPLELHIGGNGVELLCPNRHVIAGHPQTHTFTCDSSALHPVDEASHD